MYEDAKKAVKKQGYTSFSEFIRDSLRETLYEDKNRITENGFPRWFEDQVLESAAKPSDNDIVLETDEDIHNYFLHLKKPASKVK